MRGACPRSGGVFRGEVSAAGAGDRVEGPLLGFGQVDPAAEGAAMTAPARCSTSGPRGLGVAARAGSPTARVRCRRHVAFAGGGCGFRVAVDGAFDDGEAVVSAWRCSSVWGSIGAPPVASCAQQLARGSVVRSRDGVDAGLVVGGCRDDGHSTRSAGGDEHHVAVVRADRAAVDLARVAGFQVVDVAPARSRSTGR